MPRGSSVKTPENLTLARGLRDEGMIYREIAERIGVRESTVAQWLADPDLAKAKDRRRRYGGTCADCGAPTDGSQGVERAAKRCSACRRQYQSESATWTRDRIIAEGHRWIAMTGRAPLAGDWNVYQNRGERRALLDELHARTGPWPHIHVTQRVFGSWRAFIAELGHEACPNHNGGRGVKRSFRTDELRRILAAASTPRQSDSETST